MAKCPSCKAELDHILYTYIVCEVASAYLTEEGQLDFHSDSSEELTDVAGICPMCHHHICSGDDEVERFLRS